MPATCPHLGSLVPVGPGADVCEDCAAIGAPFVNRRQCLTCGHTGCCDSSTHRHAAAHNAATGHPIMRSLEAGDDWMWCYQCREAFRRRNGVLVAVDFFFEAGLGYARREASSAGALDIGPEAVTTDGFPLGTWVATYRAAAARGELDPEQRVAVEALPGWSS